MTFDEARACARAIADERGWGWEEPVRVVERRRFVLFGRKRVEIWSNAERRGRNVRVVFDSETGTLLQAAWLPR